MERSDIRTRRQGDAPFFPNMLNNGEVEVCLKEDVDKYIEEKYGPLEKQLAELIPKLKELYDSVSAIHPIVHSNQIGENNEQDTTL